MVVPGKGGMARGGCLPSGPQDMTEEGAGERGVRTLMGGLSDPGPLSSASGPGRLLVRDGGGEGGWAEG